MSDFLFFAISVYFCVPTVTQYFKRLQCIILHIWNPPLELLRGKKRHGGNEIPHTQLNPTLPSKHFLCFIQIPSAASLFLNLREVCFLLVNASPNTPTTSLCVLFLCRIPFNATSFTSWDAPNQYDTHSRSIIWVICVLCQRSHQCKFVLGIKNMQWQLPVHFPGEVFFFFYLNVSCPKTLGHLSELLLQKGNGVGEAIPSNKCDTVLMGCGCSLMGTSVSGASNWNTVQDDGNSKSCLYWC